MKYQINLLDIWYFGKYLRKGFSILEIEVSKDKSRSLFLFEYLFPTVWNIEFLYFKFSYYNVKTWYIQLKKLLRKIHL
jgi:hypothetical protein